MNATATTTRSTKRTGGRVTPTGRVGLPTDVAQALLFLASPEAAHITGQTLIIDGGWTLTSPLPPSS